MKPKYLLIGALLLLLGLVLAACSTAPSATPCPTAEPCPECPTCPECPACPAPPEPVVKEVPFQDAWANSPHNDAEAEAFTHWNEGDPPEVPTSCAKCHTTPGYQDFLGADGSEAGVVDASVPAPAGTIQCVACHNAATVTLTSVTFPSGAVIENLGPEARCMVCHQGRASKSSVDDALEQFGLTDNPDQVAEPQGDSTLGFVNIHYYAAAATLYGKETQGGYEYEGKAYDAKNDHVAGYDTCIGCHSSHTLKLKFEECAACHQGVSGVEDVRKIRMQGSKVDYDGDGNVDEGMSEEVAGMREILYGAIQAYAKDVVGTPIVYNQDAHPYFFVDANDDGQADEGDTEAYTSWTGRLLKAAYNYQVATKDPGQYAHGGKYIIELLYDSTDDLNQALPTPIDMSAMHRIDAGHFAGSEEAFRHWDEEGMTVPGTCAKCHSAAGLPLFLKEGVSISQPASNGFNCATCHNDLSTFTRYQSNSATFPSGATLTFGEANDANLCINCHQGRESKSSVDRAIASAGVGDDEVSDDLSFRNPHYFAAGATLFGAEAAGAYQYDGQEYNGRNMHVQGFDTCLGCHDTHALSVKFEACSSCHPTVKSAEDVNTIRISTDDYDGDGDATEGIAGEVQTMADTLYEAIQAYVAAQGLPGIVYNGARYPYYFDEAGEGYASWTPRLLRAAYNYQWVQKDPGAFAHNGQYIMQVLYDSIQDLGGDVSGMTRPPVEAEATQ
jgi:hypothetical protein